jgi:type VI secretion system protein ImpH
MASARRKSDAALIQDLEKEPWRFNFFRAVRLLQRTAPHAVPIGELGPARREAIRIVHDAELIFHASDVSKIRPRVIRDGVPFAEITTSFLGLIGSVSPMATFVSEDVLRAESDDEKSLKAFYDVLHHRLLSLLYRAWRKYRFQASFRLAGNDQFTGRALSFVGVDAHAMPKEGLPALHLLALAPLLAIRTRPVRSLQIILERLFPGTKIETTSFVARRVLLGDDQLSKVGVQNTTLGVDFTIGPGIVDRSGRFRVGIGPVNYETFEGLLPGGKFHPLLRKVIDQFSRGFLEVECEVTLDSAESPRFQLKSERGAKLGVTTTLRAPGNKPMRARFVMAENVVGARPQIIDDDRMLPSVRP